MLGYFAGKKVSVHPVTKLSFNSASLLFEAYLSILTYDKITFLILEVEWIPVYNLPWEKFSMSLSLPPSMQDQAVECKVPTE